MNDHGPQPAQRHRLPRRTRWPHAVAPIGVLISAMVLYVSASTGVAQAAPATLAWSSPVSIDHHGALDFAGVACPSASQCTATSRSGFEVTFNPTSPSAGAPVDVARGAGLGAVACPAATQCTSVIGNYEFTFDPNAVSASASVTSHALFSVDTVNISMNAVACVSVAQCTAVGDGHQFTFNPRSGRVVASSHTMGTIYNLLGVACYAANRCAANADEGQVFVFDPLSSATFAPIKVGLADLNAISCGSASMCSALDAATGSAVCVAVDSGGRAFAFDPASPADATAIDLDGGVPVTAVACVSATECAAVDDHGQIMFSGAPSASVDARRPAG